jgi:hypothetical protein
MPRIILYHEPTELYLEYSTVVDAPVTVAVPRDEMHSYLVKRYGEGVDGETSTDSRLDRAKAVGSSELWTTNTLEEAVYCNHAGRDGTRMSYEQFVDWFFVRRMGAESPPQTPVGDAPRLEED